MLDYELLHEYVRTASQEAFARVVAEHVDAVYSAARRQVRDPQLAQDVTQAVFMVLARRAGSLAGRGPLIGWLIRTTHFASMDALKKESRRRRHEREAANMKPEIQELDYAAVANGQLSPELDRALARLSDFDRSLISLRYLESRSIIEVGQAAGISPEAAAKRISRAMAKLRGLLIRRDALPAAVPIAAVLEHLTRDHAPDMLARAIVAGISGTASVNVSVLAKGIIKMAIVQKTTATAAVVAGTLLMLGAGVAGVAWLRNHSQDPATRTAAAPVSSVGALAPTGPVFAVLGSGLELELIGIGEHPSAGKPWWCPDGSLMLEPPFQRISAKMGTEEPNFVRREVAFRIKTSGRGAESMTVSPGFVGARASGGGSIFDSAGRTIGDLQGVAIVLPDSPNGAVFRLDVASGPWLGVGSINAAAAQTSQIGAAQYTLTDVAGQGNRTRIKISQIGSHSGRQDRRWVAMDTDGHEHQAWMRSMQSSPSGTTGELEADVPIQSLASLAFQERPYSQWLEIRNISLHPGQQTNVDIRTSDDAAVPATLPR